MNIIKRITWPSSLEFPLKKDAANYLEPESIKSKKETISKKDIDVVSYKSHMHPTAAPVNPTAAPVIPVIPTTTTIDPVIPTTTTINLYPIRKKRNRSNDNDDAT